MSIGGFWSTYRIKTPISSPLYGLFTLIMAHCINSNHGPLDFIQGGFAAGPVLRVVRQKGVPSLRHFWTPSQISYLHNGGLEFETPVFSNNLTRDSPCPDQARTEQPSAMSGQGEERHSPLGLFWVGDLFQHL